MIRLILTIMLSALAFVSMGANDCATPTQAYDSRGGLVWEMLPDVYGEVMECRGDRTLVPFRYQGQYEDTETGLYYNRFRYYSPEMGMYISSDPIGLAGNNPTLYGYVQDVNMWLDSWGLDCTKKVAQLPKLKGETVSYIQKTLQENGIPLRNPTNRRNQRWIHPDGSEIQIHKYGNTNTSPHKGGNNAHIHKSVGKHGERDTIELADDGVPVVNQRSSDAHIGIKNPSDFPTVSGRQHGI